MNPTEYVHGAPNIQDYGATEPAVNGFGAPAPTTPPPVENFGEAKSYSWEGGQTVPSETGFESFEPTSGIFEDRPGTPPAAPGGAVRIAPVVGWLVCIDGPERGKDYRIHAQNNFIGRLPSNDIVIAGDDKVSREKHVMVVFDPEDRMFYLGAPGGTNIVRLNGKPVLEAKELHIYDVVTVGSTKLMFIPFCGERFGWDG